MTTFTIRLNSVEDIKYFVSAAGRMECDIDVLCGRYLVDGKSIMGLFSIDLSSPIEVNIHGTAAEADLFKQAVARLVA